MATQKRVLIIDNGSYECRVGWHDTKEPELRFRNVLTKPRKDRKKDNQVATDALAPSSSVEECKGNGEIQVGNDITNIEAVRAHLKSPFERNVITNWNHQEQIFDYIFTKMGFEGKESIAHPIVLTEALANPNLCRRQMSELLFECYGVPAVSYGIDALYSWQHHQLDHRNVSDALIISFGYSTTHVIPVLAGRMQLENVRRLNVGGFHIINYLFRLMQMKYPVHLNAITSRMEKLVHEHCHIALDYREELLKWAQLDYYEAHVMKIQLPYNPVTASNALLTAEQKQEKRRELALRLLDIKNRREREKLQEDEDHLQLLHKLRQLYEQQKLQKFERALQQQQIANLEELDKLIGTLSGRIKRIKDRASGTPRPSKQQDKLDKMPKPPEGMPQAQWLAEMREKREELLRRKQARQQQRTEQGKRHTHAAQERMRIISTLARSEKRRKANNGEEEDDGFGMNDNDWDVYKRINRYNDDSDSDAENEQMLEYEKILHHYDASFDDANNAAMQALAAAENYQLHFGVEEIRVPEILFQPSMIGCTEAGLAELIAFVLKLFPADEQQRLVDHVYLTGSCAQFRGLKERLLKELLELRPFQSSFAIYESKDPTLSAWLGACLQAKEPNFNESLTTRSQYQEHGSEYFREHSASNLYYPTPKD
ncbi:actin-related protein 5 [Drosophila innubila]|uniref:actin-related protein 5 n=1 Tax=Drosophila innubila TaxID=198719 RepID=UPI00148E6504|nr:actin-related protein 5 [Drosophila innubila]